MFFLWSRWKKIVIFRGEGGRELLRNTLQARGAEVCCADMYQRRPPAATRLLDHYLAESDIIAVSSNEGLQNLYELVTNKESLSRHVLVVPGERAFTLATALGFDKIFVAENATDEACLNALKYARSQMSKKCHFCLCSSCLYLLVTEKINRLFW